MGANAKHCSAAIANALHNFVCPPGTLLVLLGFKFVVSVVPLAALNEEEN